MAIQWPTATSYIYPAACSPSLFWLSTLPTALHHPLACHHSPMQFFISKEPLVKPGKQSHSKLPGVLMQVPWPQMSGEIRHSSMSVGTEMYGPEICVCKHENAQGQGFQARGHMRLGLCRYEELHRSLKKLSRVWEGEVPQVNTIKRARNFLSKIILVIFP